ncbi:MAG TPA: homocysteine S-methyltransferase family protein [Gammaproteobacteria bacterium]|jgi:S-methylmethionine-dependent homocysteine/selenocysteine methylase|nr:homocysteine S-methyltransferase family protein [Gammaproteobacteria bacterium]
MTIQPTWTDTLRAGRTLVLDGGTGTELRRRGVPLDPTVWSGLASLTHYALLRSIHADYIEAGADVITTNTFGTARFVLEAAGHGEDFAAINERAVAAAREARDAAGRDVLIAGSMSCLPPRFDVGAYPDEARENAGYRELADTLAQAGVDLLIVEMLQEPRHAPLALAAARTTGLPAWLGVSCRLGAAGTLVGFDFPLVPLTECLDALLPLAPDAVAVMHSPAPCIAPALTEIRARFRGPLGAYPEIGDGTAPAALTPAELASAAEGWLDAGAQIVGGCCGTTPAHVRALRRVVAGREARRGNEAAPSESTN